MLIAGYVIDPMYILIPLFLVMICLMIGLALIMRVMVKELKGIHNEGKKTNSHHLPSVARNDDISEQQTSKSASVMQPGSTS